jgi:diacylglycerol kinase (ATP)
MNHIVRYCINLIGWGLVADVGERAEQLRWLGPSRYTASSVIEIFLKKNRRASLVMDGKTVASDFTFIGACNSVHIGKGMKMAPHAKLDDGLIDLVVVQAGITRRRLLSVLLPETNGVLNIDGEMIGTTPIKVDMLQNTIEMFA